MFRRSWKMRRGKGFRLRRQYQTPQSSRSSPQNLVIGAGGAWNLDEFARPLFEDVASSIQAVTSDEEADSSLSFTSLSPSTASSTFPPQDNSSPTTVYEYHSDCSQSSDQTWDYEENRPSRMDLVTAPASEIFPAHGLRSGQQHPRYGEQSFPLVSESALTTGSIDYLASSINPGGYGVGSAHTNRWTEVHLATEPGRDVDWRTYMSPEWPPWIPGLTAHNQSERCISLDVGGTEVSPVSRPRTMDPTTQIKAQYRASLAVAKTQPDNGGSTGIPHISWYGMIRCGSCKDADAIYHTEEGWLAHLRRLHPQWIYWDPNILKTTWYGFARCGACSGPHTMYQTEGSWWVHVWMGHPEWPSWVPDTCFWSGCTGTAFQKRVDWLAHLWSVHFGWAKWVPRHCMWEDCTSTCSPFKTSKSWLAHVKKKHRKSYWCSFPLCDRQEPFGSQNDLDRHRLQRHEPAVPCTKPNCQAKRRGNTIRSDKHEEHDRKWHGPSPCPEPGCPRRTIGGIHHGFSTEDDLEKHLHDAHHRHHRRI